MSGGFASPQGSEVVSAKDVPAQVEVDIKLRCLLDVLPRASGVPSDESFN